MDAYLMLLLATGLVAADGGSARAETKPQAVVIPDGRWIGVERTEEGERAVKIKFRFKDGRILYRAGWGACEIPHRISPGASPPSIRLHIATRAIYGSYRVQGDHLVMCFSAEPGRLPAAFRAEGKEWLWVLRRDQSAPIDWKKIAEGK